jgi:hypothetical protein
LPLRPVGSESTSYITKSLFQHCLSAGQIGVPLRALRHLVLWSDPYNHLIIK